MKNNGFSYVMSCIELERENADRIVEQCIMGHSAKKPAIRFSKQIAAALILGLCVIVPGTAYAAVSAYQSYMEEMGTEEMQERVEMVREGEKQADTFSRALSRPERERLQELRKQYEEGTRFPSESMVMIDGTNREDVTPAMPYYDYKQMVFHIPETELTDEELLQIIDVWEKANYSLVSEAPHEVMSEEDQTTGAANQMEEWKKTVIPSDEVLIQDNANALFEAVSGMDLSGADWEISSYGEEHQRYIAIAKKDGMILRVTYAEDCPVETLAAYGMTFSHQSDADPSVQVSCTESEAKERMERKAEELLPVLKKYFGVDESVSSYRCGYSSEAMTHYVIEYKDTTGDRFRCTVSFADNAVKEILKFDVGKYDDIDFFNGSDEVWAKR